MSEGINMWRDLSPAEEESFRKWARENYKPRSPISGIWHPVVQEECVKINIEHKVLIATKRGEKPFQEFPGRET